MAFGWIREHKARVVWAAVIAVAVCALFIKTTHAQDIGNAVDYVLWNLTLLFQWLIRLTGELVLFFVSLLISAAKYNNFVRAYPVVTGWVLVRDVVNMFFIVVLLVIAFSTIIGYQKLHYKGVLPKLLLMAVLINFSKTLIGVLIDFSQVVMLTFVNGFQAAAGGNFMSALKVTKVTQLNKSLIEANVNSKTGDVNAALAGAGLQSLQNVLLASVLGLVMMMIAASVLVVMVIYLLVRIVGLWLLLIMSPIAFFALALPDTMKKSLSAFTDDYWNKLSALLTGGPIVAFFLWLALATAQGKPEELNIYQSQSSIEQANLTSESVGISAAGDPNELASFVVAIVLLLTGLSTAVSITNKVSPKALGAAGAVSGLALGATKFAAKKTARGAAAVGVGAGKLGVRGAAVVGRGVERKYGERLGRIGLAAGGIPLVGGMLARGGAAIKGRATGRKSTFEGKVEKETKHLTPAEKMKYKQDAYKRASGVLGNKEEAEVLKKMILTEGMSRPGKQMKKDRLAADYYKENGIDPSKATGAEKNAAKGHADALARRETAVEYTSAMKMAKERGDTEWVGKLEEDLNKDPSLNDDLSEVNRNIASKDYRQVLREQDASALGDSVTAASMGRSMSFIDANGSVKAQADIEKTEEWEVLARSPQRAKLMREQLDNFRGAGAETLKTTLAAFNGEDGAAAKAAAERYHLVGNPTGGYQAMVTGTPGGKVAASAYSDVQTALLKTHANIVSGKADYTAFSTENGMKEMARAGIPVAQIAQYDTGKGEYANPAARKTYGIVLSDALKDLQTSSGMKPDGSPNWVNPGDDEGQKHLQQSLDVMLNVDTGAIAKGGQYADDVVENIDLETLRRAVTNAGALTRTKLEKDVHAQDVTKYEKLVAAVSARAAQVAKDVQEKVGKEASYAPTAAEKKYININVDMTSKIATPDMKLNRAVAKRGAKRT